MWVLVLAVLLHGQIQEITVSGLSRTECYFLKRGISQKQLALEGKELTKLSADCHEKEGEQEAASGD